MNKILHYNVDSICKLKGTRLRNDSYNLGETDDVISRAPWNPQMEWNQQMESADAYFVPHWKNKCMFLHSLACISFCSPCENYCPGQV